MNDVDYWAARLARTLAEDPSHPAGNNGEPGATPTAPAPPAPFPDPIPASLLRATDAAMLWLWQGVLARGGVTLLSALWKAGKSTLLAHLLRALDDGAPFLGLATRPARVLFVGEEVESLWAARRDELGLSDHVHFQLRPFAAKPRWDRWGEFLCHLKACRETFPYDLLVMDTISNLWPVRDENDATQVQSALMPLHTFAPDLAILLVHHLRKGDGGEATASRGSGALPAFVDTILELRRYNAADRKDRRRVLSGYGRWPDVPDELVAELTTEHGYRAVGDRAETAGRDLWQLLLDVLPSAPPGLTNRQITEDWPGEHAPPKDRLAAVLKQRVERGDLRREGRGARGAPYTYWLPSPDSYSSHSPIGERDEYESAGATRGTQEGDGRCPW